MSKQFQNFQSGQFESNFSNETTVLGEGTHRVKISRVTVTDDTMKGLVNPIKKSDDELPEWKDVTEQLAVTMNNSDGVTTRRFNATGYVRYSELPENMRGDYDELGSENYAVHKTKKVSIIDKNRTAQCENIINQFFYSCGLPEGSGISDLLGCETMVTIKAKEYNGNTQLYPASFSAVQEVKVVEDTVSQDAEADY